MITQNWKELIDEAVDCKTAVEFYTGQRVRNGRIPCPFHNGRDSNLAIYKNCFRCYVCGAKGGVIKFVSMFLNISNHEAQKRLNDDFGLGIPMSGRTNIAQQIAAQRRLEAIVAKHRQEAEEYDRLCEAYRTAEDYYLYFDAKVRQEISLYANGDESGEDIGTLMRMRDEFKEETQMYYGMLCERRMEAQ